MRDNCHAGIQSILKSFDKASSSKINFSKIQALWVEHKNRIDKPEKMVWSQLSVKILWVHFVTQKRSCGTKILHM